MKKLSIGEIFLIPTGGDHFALGQVVGVYGGNAYYLVTFKRRLGRGSLTPAGLSESQASDPEMIALTLDARFHSGDWEVVGLLPVTKMVSLPDSIECDAEGKLWVVDHAGSILRPALTREDLLLPYRKIVAPIRLENALKARDGNANWRAEYDELLISPID